MQRAAFFLFLAELAVSTRAQQLSVGSVKQNGQCTVAGVIGNVTVNCPGVPAAAIKALENQFNARLKDRELKTDEIMKEANEWKDKYQDLTLRLADTAVSDGLKRKAEELLKDGKLDEAGRVLDEELAGEEKQVDQIARNHFDRAQLFELQFRPLQALPHYEKAWNYRSNDSNYGQAYAMLLAKQRDYAKAEPVFEKVLQIRRELAKAKPQAYLPDVAETLNDLGVLYLDTQRLKEAADAYTEALQIRRELAKANPEAYLPDIAQTLNNLGILYNETQRLKESADAYTEALQIRRELAKANPQAYLPDVAETLNDLGVLYRDTQRLKEAADANTEALQSYRELAKANPQAYLPDVAQTLNNLGVLYRDTQRLKEAADAYTEALQIRRELAKANPQVYLPDVAQTLNNLGVLYKAAGRDSEAAEACSEAAAIVEEVTGRPISESKITLKCFALTRRPFLR
jgi:tetratricopeptide (TPR) repeat protein